MKPMTLERRDKTQTRVMRFDYSCNAVGTQRKELKPQNGMVCCTFLKENLAAIPRTEWKETSWLAVTGVQRDVEVKGQILGRRCREIVKNWVEKLGRVRN